MPEDQLLLLSDHELHREELLRAMNSEGIFQLDRVRTSDAADEALNDGDVSLVLVDMDAVGVHSGDFVEDLRKIYSADRLPVILLTPEPETRRATRVLERGANDFVTKPVDYGVLLDRIGDHLR